MEQRTSPTIPGRVDQEGSVALEQIQDRLGHKKGTAKRSNKGDSQEQGSENSFQATQKTAEQVVAEVLQIAEQLGIRISNLEQPSIVLRRITRSVAKQAEKALTK